MGWIREDMTTDNFADLKKQTLTVDPAKYALALKLLEADEAERREILLAAHVEASEIIALIQFAKDIVPKLIAMAL